MSTTLDPIRVFHVDDEPDFAAMTATYLTREDDRFEVETETRVRDALDRLSAGDFDCVVSDYDMPGQSGIEFLENVREEHPDLPFILYTGKGSEAVASDAISAGVTDYLQKGTGNSQYAVLANRIANAVENHRMQTELADREQRLTLFFEQSPLGVIEWDANFDCVRMNDAAEEILGYTEDDLAGRSWEQIVPDSDRDAVDAVVSDLLENTGRGHNSLNENVRGSGERIVCEWHNRVVTDEGGDVVAIFSQFQDVTERRKRESAIKSLHTTTNELMEAESAETVAEVTTYAVRGILDMPANGVHLHDDEGGLVPVAWTEQTEEIVGEPPTFAPGEGLAGTAFETGQPLVYDDISSVPERYNSNTRIRSQIVFPLGDHGVLVIGSPEPDDFDDVDVSLVEITATHTTTALDRVARDRNTDR